MKKIIFGTVLVVMLAATFFSGYWYSRGLSSGAGLGEQRTILYYIDPMNPGNRYDKPGIAPCGMALEPVYGSGGTDGSSVTMPPGSVMITPDKQQLIGVRIEQVEKSSSTHIIRFLGKVAADETRIYQVTSSVAGLIRQVNPLATGSLVKKSQVLASFFAPEFLAAEQSYILALNSPNLRATVRTPGVQASVVEQDVPQNEDNLRLLGMGENQIRLLSRTREYFYNIDIESPVTGFVLTRNISAGLRFAKGAEFYRIADLGEVWIVIDTYGEEASFFHPGDKVPVHYQGVTFDATVSDDLPQFDASTRTLKVRLIAANPDYVLRPDMFVDVEYPVVNPSALTVPVDAVLDSGRKKTVFVDRGNGYFEPRRIETGKHLGDRVEILLGLMPGERIVVSGNFLIDSESRFKSPSTEVAVSTSTDPICGMTVNEEEAVKSGLTTTHQGETSYFCSKQCKEKFDSAMQSNMATTGAGIPADTGNLASIEAVVSTSTDPICGMTVNEEEAVKSGLTTTHRGGTAYFCSKQCKEKFDEALQDHTGTAAGAELPAGDAKPADGMHDHMKMAGKENKGTTQDYPSSGGAQAND
jgi:membrane fusion protein, copper/silver efflux system